MKSKRIVHTGDKTVQTAASPDQADLLLSEMSRLYRERFRAMYNNDELTLKSVNQQIDLLKTRLTKI